MPIPIKIKAKIFAAYLEQICITPTRKSQGESLPFKFLKGILKEIDLGMVNDCIGLLLEDEIDISNHTNYSPDEISLLLKPLSEITDEDAIEIGKILISPHAIYHVSNKEWLIKNYKYWIENGLVAVYSSNAKSTLQAYQYLQSKGYALPYMEYSVEYLVKERVYKLI
jgi:hypothetical protein